MIPGIMNSIFSRVGLVVLGVAVGGIPLPSADGGRQSADDRAETIRLVTTEFPAQTRGLHEEVARLRCTGQIKPTAEFTKSIDQYESELKRLEAVVNELAAEFARQPPREKMVARLLKSVEKDSARLREWQVALRRTQSGVVEVERKQAELWNKRQELMTSFENTDQKTNELFTILSTVLRNEKEQQAGVAARNIN